MPALELKLPPLLLVALFALAMWLQAELTPALSFNWPGQTLLVGVLAILGVAIVSAAILTFRQAHTTVDPTQPECSSSVVSHGIYSYTRNPMYLGFCWLLLALALQLGNPLALLWLPLFVAYMTRFQIRPEERALQAKFAVEYSAYLARVRRWW
jgi:protein-S-isoprenylcysteine O-methyltransferase Ste14